jgi:hypothetical protein
MWKRLYELVTRVITVSRTLAEHEKEIEGLQRELREAVSRLHIVVIELNRLSDQQAFDRQNLKLWVENQFLQFEKRRPPALPGN